MNAFQDLGDLQDKEYIPEKSQKNKDIFQIESTSHTKSLLHRLVSGFLFTYTMYTLLGVLGFVSHLGARVPWTQNFLIAKGYASGDPLHSILDFFINNLPAAFLFVISHSLLRPPKIQQLIGFRYARLVYCAWSGATLHLFLISFRPLSLEISLENSTGVFDDLHKPLFSLPVPKSLWNFLSISMILFSFTAFFLDKRSFIITGYNRALYGVSDPRGFFPQELSPRMDIITWLGYTTWLRGGNIAFILFSGLSIIPYNVYTWDVIIRVVAAAYLRHRSQGFKIWVNQIESTHHFIWILRALMAGIAVFYSTKDKFDVSTLVLLASSGIIVAFMMNYLEKIHLKSGKQKQV